jgi:hypothetical protein
MGAYFKVIAGVWFACHCGLVSMAGDSVSSPPAKADAAWVVLTRHSDKRDPKELSKAVLDIVHAAHEEDLDKLLDYMQSEEFDRAFAFPKNAPDWQGQPFSKLMLAIAKSNRMFSEELLVQYAHSNRVFGRYTATDSQQYHRSISVVWAMGYLHPRTTGTYSLPAMGIARKLQEASGHAVASLARIGDDRAAAIFGRMLAKTKASDIESTARSIALAGRDRPAMFGFLLELAEDANDFGTQKAILQNLVADQLLPLIPDVKPINFPSYSALSNSDRERLFEQVKRRRFAPESEEVVNQLKRILSRR